MTSRHIEARGLRGSYIGLAARTETMALWHLGDSLEHAFCGRPWTREPGEVNREAVYDREWVCATCLRRAQRDPG